MRSWITICVLILTGSAGCAKWSTEPAGNWNPLPLPKLTPESVVLSVVFVREPSDEQDLASQFWPEVDEQVLPNDLRRRLGSNGMRCGLVGTTLPIALQEVLDREVLPELSDGAAMVVAGHEPVARSQRIHSPAGQAGKIMVRSDPIGQMAALMLDEEGHVRGESLEQAQLYFAIKSFPQGDGEVRLELTPVIEHGQSRSRYAAQKGVWALDSTSRPARVFDELKIIATLAPGQSLALGSTDLARGIGRQFFAEDPAASLPSLLLLVRIQQTQRDNRFDSQLEADSGTTALD